MRRFALTLAACLLLACGASTEQRAASVAHAWSLARGVCSVCNSACRLVPGTAQSAGPVAP